MPQSTRGGGGRGRGRGRGAASAAPSGALAMARTPSNVSISSDGVPGTPTSTATARASPAPARPPLIRVASGPQISSAPTSASPTTPNATASVNLQTLSSIQTPGHPQYQQYMAALNYYMTQFSVGGGMSQGAPGAASASVSPASTTPNATPPGTPQMGTATAAVDLTRLPNLQMPARPTSAGSASAARPAPPRLGAANARPLGTPVAQMSQRPHPYLPASAPPHTSFPPPVPQMHMRPGGAASTPTMALRYDPRDPRDPANMPMLSKERLRVLVAQIDPAFRLENDVEEMMLEIADDFLTSVTEKACRLARHRDSVRVGVRDARIPLEQDWNIRVPGFGAEPAPHDKDDSDAPGASTTAATGADGKDDAAATATDNAADPDSKSRLHTQRVQKVREAIRDAGKHRHSGASSALGTTLPGTAAGISMNNTSAAGPAAGAQSASAAAGQPGAVAGGVRKSTASKPKPGTAAAKTKGRGAAG